MPQRKELKKLIRDRYRKEGVCTTCGKIRKSNFLQCESCIQERRESYHKHGKRWYAEMPNKEEYLQFQRDYKHQAKQEVLDAYGNKCACCGETNWFFLTIDHVNNDGAEHRKTVKPGTQFYIWLKKNNFPPEFRILCWNCNCGRRMNGGICPHQNVVEPIVTLRLNPAV